MFNQSLVLSREYVGTGSNYSTVPVLINLFLLSFIIITSIRCCKMCYIKDKAQSNTTTTTSLTTLTRVSEDQGQPLQPQQQSIKSALPGRQEKEMEANNFLSYNYELRRTTIT